MTFNETIKQEIMRHEYDAKTFDVLLAFFLYKNFEIVYDRDRETTYLELGNYSRPILEFLANNLQTKHAIASNIVAPSKNQKLYRLRIQNPLDGEFLNLMSAS